MRRTLIWTDRVVVGLLGLLLVVGGLAVVDWRYRVVLDTWPDALDAGPAASLTDAGWWPWAVAGVGVLLGLLGLRWLLAHLRRERPGDVRLGGSEATGLLAADVPAVASAVAERFAELAPVTDASGTTRREGAQTLVEVRAHLEPGADAETLAAAALQCTREVAQAFPDGEAACRVLLSAPRRRRRRPQQVRVD